jgi:hypothetical protein
MRYILAASLLLASPAFADDAKVIWVMSVKTNAGTLIASYPEEAKCKEARAVIHKADRSVVTVCVPVLQ